MKQINILTLSILLLGASAGNLLQATAPNVDTSVEPFGTNLSGGEFGGVYPGSIGTHYGYPTNKCLDYFKSKGLTLIRFPFRWERLQRTNGTTLNVDLDQTELGRLKTFIAEAEARNMKIIPDMHNFARYSFDGGTTQTRIDDNSNLTRQHLGSIWRKLAEAFASYSNIWGYDIMNEPYNMQGGVDGGTHWKAIAQVVIDSIRTVDTHTPIIICGDRYSSALYWLQASDRLKDLVDPANKLIFSSHVYFDKDQSGNYAKPFSEEGAHTQTGVDRVKPFVDWLKANNKKGFVGEYGIPTDEATPDKYLPVLDNMLEYLSENGIPGTYWSAGPRWTETNPHTLSTQPTNNYTKDKPQMDVLTKYPTTKGQPTSSNMATGKNTISVYPNPTTGRLNIQTDAIVEQVTLKDIAGRTLLEQHLPHNTLSLQHLPAGIYILRIHTNNGTTDCKTVKQ
jgi:endoglucanase